MLYMWGKNPQSYSSNSLCSLISFYLEYLDDIFHMEISLESGSSLSLLGDLLMNSVLNKKRHE